MANTMTLISSVTLDSSGASSITFSSIPQTYNDLKLVWSARHDVDAADQIMYFNGDNSNTQWSEKLVRGVNGSAGSESYSSQTNLARAGYNSRSSYVANAFGNGEFYIPNYTSSNYKSISVDSVNASNDSYNWLIMLAAGLRANTAAITSITIAPYSGNYVQYTNAYLYGIKNS